MTDHSHSHSDSVLNPFGYTVLSPGPDLSHARGQPILDNFSQSHLNNFFDSPDHTSILQNPSLADYTSQDLTYDQSSTWWTDPSSSFLPSYPQQSNGDVPTMSEYSTRTQDTDRPESATHQPTRPLFSELGIDANAPEDVVQAAMKLYQYQSQSQRQPMLPQSLSRPALTTHTSFTTPSASASSQRRASDNAHLPGPNSSRAYSAMQYSQHTDPHLLRHSTDALSAYSPPSAHHYSAAQPYQFGSDALFGTNGYGGTYQNATEQSHMKFIQGITRYPDQSGAASAASSLPQSPVAFRHETHSYSQQDHSQSVKQEASLDPSTTHYPVKRRRTMSSAAVKDNGQYAPYPVAFVPETQSSPEGDDAASSESSPESADDNTPVNPRKRRKSSSAAQVKANTAVRKNLTEDQKRENHIRSEQKRRNIIRDGYKNLNELVPNLKQGGFSKSATLTETVRELETLQAAKSVLLRRIMEGTGWSQEKVQAEMQTMSGTAKTRP